MLREIPDPEDVYVATVAAYLAELVGSTVVLSTHDLGDLPQEAMAPFNVLVLHPVVFLEIPHNLSPKQVAASLGKTADDFKRP